MPVLSIPSARPIVFGEILVGQAASGEGQPEGLPFNVAWHLRGLGLDPLLIGTVDSGTVGATVLETMRDWGMDPAGIQFDLELPEAAAACSGMGHSSSACLGHAYRGVDTALATTILQGSTWALLYHIPAPTRTALKPAVFETLAAASRAPLFLDGAPWEGLSPPVSRPSACRWLKLTRAQLHEMSGVIMDDLPSLLAAAQELRRRHHLALLLVTDAERGIYSLSDHGTDFAPAEPIGSAETTGAFSAACIFGLTLGWPPHTLLSRAFEFAAAVRTLATPRPDRIFYARVVESWSR